ncbi:MAG: RagB/SusD family nutrient uptake outer membrane protein [Bacteroidales bacterium]|nr:RagB/SusD family nutrient uptake outer membrane protein [Bacteroidales bacterium]
MKKIIYSVILIFALLSCRDDVLETVPTNKADEKTVFTTVENAFTALNGMYRAFFVDGSEWVEYFEDENAGVAALGLAVDLFGDDMSQNEGGSAWFWYDYNYWVRSEVNSTGDRPYAWWNMHYKFINNANFILANIDNTTGDDNDRNSIKAQALALRASSYFNLIRLYQRTYIGHQSDPGVPLYTEPTNKDTEGKGRGTVEEVYTQINSDLDEAITLFQSASSQYHISHIDLYVAYGLKARVALTQEDWNTAATNASFARGKPGVSLMSTADVYTGFNSVSNQEWMWASEVNDEQTLSWTGFWTHMDAGAGGYAQDSRKCVSRWLYDQIDANDVRKDWFVDPNTSADDATGPDFRYNQIKFTIEQAGSWSSDLLYMRMAEMYLIEAEARCMLTSYTTARELLDDVVGYKDPNFAATLAAIPSGNTLSLGTAGPVNNLLDLIILQRRIELWGEGFRVFDIERLKTGFDRAYAGSNHSIQLTITDPESWEWIMMIPQKEFDGNINMNQATDQNP